MFAPAAVAQDGTCGDCHGVDPALFAETVHGMFECVDCHAGAEELPHPDDVRGDCAACHDDAVAAHEQSVHGELADVEIGVPPGCASCHGDMHELVPLSDESSPPSTPAGTSRTPGIRSGPCS